MEKGMTLRDGKQIRAEGGSDEEERRHGMGLKLNKEKCEFFKNEIIYLGYKINQNVIQLDPQRIKIIQEYARPKNLKTLRGFLGMLNYYKMLMNKLGDLKRQNDELQKKLELKDIEMREQHKLFQIQLKDKLHEILSPIFTPGQIRKLLHPKQKNVKWSSEDIASAKALRSVSPKGYRYLRKKATHYLG
ncbi:uncharacterized protein LOC130892991 [Diorhabda carinulata]|uniref:uncharacterized protein LOC130892980 n=1 Tax=Diorhabda carinulata TaxID=1163345 RepID=UPI0025A16399|nr:uncharacterized protein LOC130892980 [Diorhabda carinulata]XP_057654735.1 uncharacterized protein LOC130892991 [Diorhabda carinulata]